MLRTTIAPPVWRGGSLLALCTVLRRCAMEKPRIRHIALNVQNREALAEYYTRVFGLEEKYRGPNGTIYLSDGFVGVALISRPELPWGINHFGFEVEDVPAIEEATQTKAEANTFGAVAESWIRDPEGNRVDISEHGWPGAGDSHA